MMVGGRAGQRRVGGPLAGCWVEAVMWLQAGRKGADLGGCSSGLEGRERALRDSSVPWSYCAGLLPSLVLKPWLCRALYLLIHNCSGESN